jgi:hypothetical protein
MIVPKSNLGCVYENLRPKSTWVYPKLYNIPGSRVIESTERERKVDVKDRSH